ncbi:MAG: alpha-L-fucosidase [Lentisphaeria bacterium]|nr:alpha-L-fucosidase [Lentisphaeria bacterium]
MNKFSSLIIHHSSVKRFAVLRRDEDYFSVRKLERQISLYTALGGNFLLNLGPDETGCIPEKARSILRRIGQWHKTVAKALTAKPCYGLLHLPGILCTGEGRELNLIMLNPPAGESLRLKGLQWLPKKAILLNSCEELTLTHGTELDPQTITLRKLPADRMNDEIQVIRLEFDEEVIRPTDATVYEDHSRGVAHG